MTIRLLSCLLCAMFCCAAFAQTPALSPVEAVPATGHDTGQLDPLLAKAHELLDGVEKIQLMEPKAVLPEQTVTLDAKACVELALKQNPKVGVTDASLEDAESKIGVAKSARMPQVKATAGLTYTPSLDISVPTIPLVSSLIPMNQFAPKKAIGTAGLGVEQVIYAGGQIEAAIRASEYLAKSEEWKRRTTLLDLAFEAKQAYYDAIAAHGLVAVANDSISAFERHYTDAKTKLEQGMASKFELLRAETELRARESDLESAKTAEQLALLNLRRVIGMSENQAVTLAGDFPFDPLETPLETLIAEAAKNRPELAALDAGIEAARANVDMKHGAYLPKAAAKAQYQIMEGNSKAMPDGLTVSAGVEWSLYAGGKRNAEMAGAKAQLRGLELQRADVARLVELDVRQAHARASEAVARIRKEKAARALGAEGRELAELRFQQGAGIQADTLDAELALSQAQTMLVQAVRQYAVAIAGLEKAVGRSPLGAEGAIGPEPCRVKPACK